MLNKEEKMIKWVLWKKKANKKQIRKKTEKRERERNKSKQKRPKNLPSFDVEVEEEFTGEWFGVDVENVTSGVGNIF